MIIYLKPYGFFSNLLVMLVNRISIRTTMETTNKNIIFTTYKLKSINVSIWILKNMLTKQVLVSKTLAERYHFENNVKLSLVENIQY